MTNDLNVCDRAHVVLINDAIGVQNAGGINIEQNNTEGNGSDQAGAVWVEEGEVDICFLDVGILQSHSDGLLVLAFHVEALEEGFHLQAFHGEVSSDGVIHLEAGFEKAFFVDKNCIPKFHVLPGGGQEVDVDSFPLGSSC
jgi:hypothetical protein